MTRFPPLVTLLEGETGVTVFDSNLHVVEQSDVVVLAVKPQSMRPVLENLHPVVSPEHLVVSIAAGITIASIAHGLKPGTRVVRVMSNTPALIGEGASAYALGRAFSPTMSESSRSFSILSARRSALPNTYSTPSPGSRGAGPLSFI